MEYTFYVLQDDEGNFYRKKSGRGDFWVPNFKDARVYTEEPQAKRMASWLGSEEFTPKILVFSGLLLKIIDRSDHVKNLREQQKEEKERSKQADLKRKEKEELETLKKLRVKYGK
jgi:hypothetical protein